MAKRIKSPAFANAQKGLDDHGYAGVGHYANHQYPDGTPVAYVAAIQEFGYPEGGIPPRSFHRTTIAEKRKEWADIMAKQGKMIAQGKLTLPKALTQIGLLAAGQMREKIAEITDPPLSPVTLQLRKWKAGGIKITGKLVGQAKFLASKDLADTSGVSNKPLVDTRVLLPTLVSEYHE